MGKMKTHSGCKKRFKMTKNGKVKHGRAFTSHLALLKTTKQRRKLRRTTVASDPDAKIIKSLMPYS